MRLLQLLLVLLGALMVGVAAAVAPLLSREAGIALCAIATVWAAMLGACAISLSVIGEEQEEADPGPS